MKNTRWRKALTKKRNQFIYDYSKSGKLTYDEIAYLIAVKGFKEITRQRVGQIIKQMKGGEKNANKPI